MKKIFKKTLALVLAATLVMGLGVTAFAADASGTDEVSIDEGDKPFIALGADLSADQRSTVLSLFGLTEEDLVNYDVITVTNAQEHQYLDAYIPSSTIGTHAYSSVVVWEADKGSGITVTTKNINYCTSGMYANALATAGITDANVIVAAPFEISGTAALIGAIEAYAVMTGTTIDTDIIDGAIDEIVTTGAIEESSGESEEIEGIIAYLKDNMDVIEDLSDSELDEEIRNVAAEFNVSLSDSEVEQIRNLIRKLGNLNLDWGSIGAQAEKLFDRLENSGFDLSNLGFDSESTNVVIRAARTVVSTITGFFQRIFNRN